MNPIMNIGVSGMRAAQARYAAHSANIVRLNTPVYAPLPAGHIYSAVGAVSRSRRNDLLRQQPPGGAGGDLAADFIGIIRARQDYLASAALLRTADKMQGELLDVLI